MPIISPLCQLNGGCMGCCGHDFISKEKIKEAIVLNTKEYSQITSLDTFRDRAYPSDLRSGVCRNLIEEKGCFFCPLHPARNSGKDLREGHCNVNYLCKTAKEFADWNEETKNKFMEFIRSKGLDNISYSIIMDNGELLKEFKG
ncbi:MAG: hypothetical protein Q8Q01_04465 [archaeon]|nr:hypothetical protein [archaeon]